MKTQTMVGYYRANKFNPVPIPLQDKSSWETHVAKRLNLYQRHLGIPIGLLEGQSVLEFGCNSGESAMVLASRGARLTLVEPNEQVLPRLKDNFKRFALDGQIDQLVNTTIEDFQTDEKFALMIAEGFLYTLKNRDQVFLKIANFIRPGGLGVVSFNDPYGNLIELTKRLVLYRACELAGIKDAHSEDSLNMALKLFEDDFKKLNASRPFHAWWKDMLVSPFFSLEYLWTYEDLLKLLDQSGCQFLATSPVWSTINHYNWYKNVPDAKTYHKAVFDNWRREMPFILTGIKDLPKAPAASIETVRALEKLAHQISGYSKEATKIKISEVIYPATLDKYLQSVPDKRVRGFNLEMKKLYKKLLAKDAADLIQFYKNTQYVRNLWGSAYHYMSFHRP